MLRQFYKTFVNFDSLYPIFLLYLDILNLFESTNVRTYNRNYNWLIIKLRHGTPKLGHSLCVFSAWRVRYFATCELSLNRPLQIKAL